MTKKMLQHTLNPHENVLGYAIEIAIEDFAGDYEHVPGVEGSAEDYLFSEDTLELQLAYFGYKEGTINHIRRMALAKRKELKHEV